MVKVNRHPACGGQGLGASVACGPVRRLPGEAASGIASLCRVPHADGEAIEHRRIGTADINRHTLDAARSSSPSALRCRESECVGPVEWNLKNEKLLILPPPIMSWPIPGAWSRDSRGQNRWRLLLPRHHARVTVMLVFAPDTSDEGTADTSNHVACCVTLKLLLATGVTPNHRSR